MRLFHILLGAAVDVITHETARGAARPREGAVIQK
jgi:hypothetical protein